MENQFKSLKINGIYGKHVTTPIYLDTDSIFSDIRKAWADKMDTEMLQEKLALIFGWSVERVQSTPFEQMIVKLVGIVEDYEQFIQNKKGLVEKLEDQLEKYKTTLDSIENYIDLLKKVNKH